MSVNFDTHLLAGLSDIRLLSLQLGLSWAIAGSRIVDNKHNPSDVVAGFFLGASVAVVFLLRSIPCLK